MQFNEQEFAESQSESGIESQESTNTDTRIEDKQLELEEAWVCYLNSIVVIDDKTPESHSDVWKKMKEKEREKDRAKLNRFTNRFNRSDSFCYEPPSNLNRFEPPIIHEFSADDGGSVKLGMQRDAGYRYIGDRGERKPKLLGNDHETRANRVDGEHTVYMPKQVFLSHRMDQYLSFALNQHFKDDLEEDIPDRIPVDQAQKILDSQIRSFNKQTRRRNQFDRQKAIILWKSDKPHLLFPTSRLNTNVLQSEAMRRENKSKTTLAKRAPEVNQTEPLKAYTAAERKRNQRAAERQNETSFERKTRKAKAALERKAQREAKKGKLSIIEAQCG